MQDNKVKIELTAVDKTREAFQSAMKNANALGESLTSLPVIGAAITAAIGTIQFGAFISETIDLAAALDDVAQKTGGSVDGISGLADIAKSTGTDFGVLEGGLTKLAKVLGDADGISRSTAKAFANLGIDAKKLARLDTDDALVELSRAFSGVEDSSTKTAAAVAIFGKEGADLIPLLNDIGSAGEIVASVTAEQAKQAADFQDQIAGLKLQLELAGRTAALEFLPSITAVVDELNRGIKEAGGFWEALRIYSSIDPFGDNVSKIESERAAIARYTQDLERLRAAGVSADNENIKQNERWIAESMQRIKLLEQNRQADRQRQAQSALQLVAGYEGETAEGRGRIDTRNARTISVKGDDPKNVSERASAYDQLYASLQKQLFAMSELTELEKLEIALSERKNKDLSPAQEKNLRTLAGELDAKRQMLDVDKQVEELSKRRSGDLADLASRIESTRDEVAGFGLSASGLTDLAAARLSNELAILKTEQALRGKAGQETAEIAYLREKLSLVTDLSKEQSKLAQRAFNERVGDMDFDIDQRTRTRDEQDRAGEVRRLKNSGVSDEDIEANMAKYDAMIARRKALDADWAAGFEVGFKQYLEDAGNTFDMAGEAAEGIFGSMEDSLVDFVTTGKLNFKDFANSVISDLVRIAARQAIVSLAGSAFGGGFAKGGVFDGDVSAFADGGVFTNAIINSPTLFKFAQGGAFKTGLMGEAGPEAVMPLTRDSAGRLGVRAQVPALASVGGAPGNIQHSTTVVVQADGTQKSTSDGAQQGRELSRLVDRAVVEVIQRELRPGGKLYGGGKGA